MTLKLSFISTEQMQSVMEMIDVGMASSAAIHTTASNLAMIGELLEEAKIGILSIGD